MDDSVRDTLVLDSLESLRDARAAWDAVQYCIRRELPFPKWVLAYLSDTGAKLEDFLDNRDEHGPTRLIYALGFDRLHTMESYDYDRDPEVIFETITTWITSGEVKNVAEGARRYVDEVLGGIGDPDTVRKAFYKGRKQWKLPEPWDPDLVAPRNNS
jgi:hypothetical protein